MSYDQLEARFRRAGHLAHAGAILHWDEAVMMPEGGGPARADAMATLRVMGHELVTDPALGDWIADAEASVASLDEWQRANLREIQRSWRRATAIPRDLVEARSRADTLCEQAWRRLRPENDWDGLRPQLEAVVSLARQAASALSDALGLAPYDALLDGFEPGMRGDALDELFGELRAFLPEFTRRVLERQSERPFAEPRGPFDLGAQRRLGLRMIEAVGFDLEHGRVDVSHHPFCGGVPRDVRITTRYDEGDFGKALMAVLHETGHAKYQQGLPAGWLEQPVGRARSMGIHESQSLLQEMQVTRSREFMAFAAPIIREELAAPAREQPAAFEAENLYRLCTFVRADRIRVDADEVTYPSHVILRYGIERPLIEGRIEVADIPELWDEGMQELLDISTGNDFRDGCMQDVHWAAGLFGYFPTYTLGAIAAAQIFAAAVRDIPDARERIARGSFDALNTWLRDRIWSIGCLLSTEDLMLRATGSKLDTADFRRHLERRYVDGE